MLVPLDLLLLQVQQLGALVFSQETKTKASSILRVQCAGITSSLLKAAQGNLVEKMIFEKK